MSTLHNVKPIVFARLSAGFKNQLKNFKATGMVNPRLIYINPQHCVDILRQRKPMVLTHVL